MSIPEVLPTSAFRSQLAALVERVVNTPGERVYLGSYRKAEAVLMSVEADLPQDLLGALLLGFAKSEASDLIRDRVQPGESFRLSKQFTDVVGWLWRGSPNRLTEFLAEHLYWLQKHPDAPLSPLRLEDVLRSFRMRLPANFTVDDYEALCVQARDEVPRYAGLS